MPLRPPTGRGLEARHERDADRRNLAIRRLYRTRRWELLRARVLVEAAYTCAACHRVGLELDVDHVVPHRGDLALFWDRGNLQALCHSPCHKNKTARGE
jgi:5-methylcytosine-specific restriction endonuclease McrA